MRDSYLFDGLRSPLGRNTGALARIRPDDLAAQVIARLMERTGVPAEAVDDIILGCTNQAGEDSRNIARHAALLAGMPVTVPGITVNRACASGLSAVLEAARTAATGGGDLFIAGGVESMSRGPFVIGKSAYAFSRDFHAFDSSMGARFPNPRITEKYGNDSMPQTAENIASDLSISREASDAFALRSQAGYAKAYDDGFFEDEVVAISVPTGVRGQVQMVDTDEHPRPNTTIDKLAALSPLFPGGVVTAGNASGINDGAAALLVGNARAAERYGLAPRARIVGSAVIGVEPRVMGLGPVPSSRLALDRAGLALSDMDVIEINEAFATQVLGCLKQLDLAADDPRVNPNGGAVALGHPTGMSGARLALTALRELERRDGRYALVTMCVGVGQGIAVVLERVEN